ncbi:MAG TPA: CoA pyrophosphatase [Anaerolineales bacterium]|nr:CoA pyrophosphatase [Anaerolineales bacterium]
MNNLSFTTLTETEIARRLAGIPLRNAHSPFPPGFFQEPARPAAILIPFTCLQNVWHLLFIRRTHNENDRHGGQVAFPGGRMDSSDLSLEATALREAEEEIGLKPSDVHILGRMYDFHSVTNYIVTPIVGMFKWPYLFQIDPQEVSRVFTIPLAWLATPDNHQIMARHIPPHKPWPVIYFDPYDGEVLWGFTAQVVMHLLDILNR